MIKKLTEYQDKILLVPQPVDKVLVLNLLGGRSSGKTVASWAAAGRHCVQHGEDASILVVRKRLKSLAQYMGDIGAFLSQSLKGVSVNHNNSTLAWHGRVVMTFAAIDSGNILEFSGRNHTALIIEEAGDIEPGLVDQLALTLRKQNYDREGNLLPLLFMRCGTPGGSSHLALKEAFIDEREPWIPYIYGGLQQVTIPGTLEDNPYNPENYGDQFLALKETSGEGVYQAHRFGAWDALQEGTYFGTAFSFAENMIDAVEPDQFSRSIWAADWGTASPAHYLILSVLGWDLQLKTGYVLPAGTIICRTEYSTAIEGSLTKGDERSPGAITPHLEHLQARHGISSCRGYLDCAAAANVAGLDAYSVLQYHNLATDKIKWHSAPKGDIQGRMEKLREMIAQRKIVFVRDQAPYMVKTLVSQPRDKYSPNDMAVRGPGSIRHAIDALSYGVEVLTRGQVGGHCWK